MRNAGKAASVACSVACCCSTSTRDAPPAVTLAGGAVVGQLVGGLLNLLTWPMMLLSGIWFSLEGSPSWVQWVAHVFPLTHVLDAARAVMLDGAGVAQIAPHLLFLGATALAFLAFGAWSFRWRID